MDVPSFTTADVAVHLAAGDLEEAFSRFVREARGKLVSVSEPILGWLRHENNRLLPEASLVYRAWLASTGDTVTVENALAEWLAANESAPGIDHLFTAWLQAGGQFAVIRNQVFDWVRIHGLERDAVFLMKYVTKQRILPDDVTLTILKWCTTFAGDPDAIWRLNSLSAHISVDLFDEAVRASQATLEPLFADATLAGVTRSQVTTVLGNLAKLEHFASHPPLPELDALLCRWMNHPQSFEPTARHGVYHQTRAFLIRLLEAAERAPATPELTPLLEWASSWEEKTRLASKDLIKRIRAERHNAKHGRPRAAR